MLQNVVGAQLYTLRDYLKTLPDIQETLKKVADIGYTAVQLSGIGPVDPAELAEAVKSAGLKAVATHVSWDRFVNDLDNVIAEHKLWDCSHAAVGCLTGEYYEEGGMDRFLAELAPVAEKLNQAGIDFSFHNHNHELARCGDKTWLETLYDKAPADQLKAEIDTYWITAGGGDPAAWIAKYPNRQPLLHLKDMCVTPQREQRFAEIGEGNLNWPAILAAAKEAGVKWYLVEQDNCYDRDPFESLAISYRNLKEMGLS